MDTLYKRRRTFVIVALVSLLSCGDWNNRMRSVVCGQVFACSVRLFGDANKQEKI